MSTSSLAPVVSADAEPHGPARTRPMGRSLACLAAVCLLYAGTAVLQTVYGTLMSDVGLTGGTAPVAAVLLGAFDILVVTVLCLLIVWSWGKALRVSGPMGPAALAAVSAALLCSALAEAGSLLVELAVTGDAPVVLATSPARWTGVPALGFLSLSNAVLYAVLTASLLRDGRWGAARAVAPVLTIAVLAAGTSALG
ncbi:hypothetical protein [Streptomyces althioticus]|uniref:hypothetical protein n=1 Tax=Streptomyces althioticus TaxID=83380 RepID=UPI003403B98D